VQTAKLSELVEPPGRGRVFTETARPGLADCAPSGRVRLDALARFTQDIAFADAVEAGLSERSRWVVRRTRMRVERFPRFGESLTLATFCSGLGRMWAERRTSIASDGGAGGRVEVVSLWVHLDPASGKPTPVLGEELAVWAESAAGRRVTARLHHPGPQTAQKRLRWRFRGSECDFADHVNNAAYFVPLEEELLQEAEPASIDVEIEYRSPAQPGEKAVVRDGARRWIVSPEGETHASLLVVDRAPTP
jgi:acyl-ACP thioesterase